MKNILLILIIVGSLISCQKSSLSLVKDTWSGHYTKDTVKAANTDSAKKLAFDCPGDRKWNADTVLPYNHGEPEAIATTWQEISAGSMRYIIVTEIAPGYFQRLYFTFEYKKTNS